MAGGSALETLRQCIDVDFFTSKYLKFDFGCHIVLSLSEILVTFIEVNKYLVVYMYTLILIIIKLIEFCG